MLGDHPDHEFVLQQRVAVVEPERGEEVEHTVPHLLEVGARRAGREQSELAAFRALVREGVVQVVVTGQRQVAADGSQQPQLLEPADVGQIPDERRLERRVLRRQLLVRQSLEQPLGARAGADELRR